MPFVAPALTFPVWSIQGDTRMATWKVIVSATLIVPHVVLVPARLTVAVVDPFVAVTMHGCVRLAPETGSLT